MRSQIWQRKHCSSKHVIRSNRCVLGRLSSTASCRHGAQPNVQVGKGEIIRANRFPDLSNSPSAEGIVSCQYFFSPSFHLRLFLSDFEHHFSSDVKYSLCFLRIFFSFLRTFEVRKAYVSSLTYNSFFVKGWKKSR